ncbi:HIG1 domain-containing protein [Qipengyuania sp. 1XM1-15A]|uniref:HIG1 domain-containing protein n=1 Tax=Qipengyuania xiamenensis TaxID=2867237 RepID=UPI001C88643F|nr:HIG1 domain-containing protein [Qipengyuania xiamenensis]MBX7533779.1 HIG1 domain-containing protein [Qipengyuania xiamenensis]
MNTVFIIVLLAAMVMVVVSLVRGVIAFLKSTKVDLESGQQVDATEMQLKQNKAMMARVKWQAAAIVVLAVMMAAAS